MDDRQSRAVREVKAAIDNLATTLHDGQRQIEESLDEWGARVVGELSRVADAMESVAENLTSAQNKPVVHSAKPYRWWNQ